MNLHCVNIPTPNADQLAKFYAQVLGAKIDDSHAPNRIEIRFGQTDSIFIVAHEDKQYLKPTTAHQGFEFFVEDVDAEYKRICALDVEIFEEPKDLSWGYRFFNIKDPDGNSIDIVQKL